ncbi:MAG: hypothetical protein Q3990_06390 [Desulfovibrionaceae bacterium]|nr:hypothetical protein [Desulfovibrionaceae bacterium]
MQSAYAIPGQETVEQAQRALMMPKDYFRRIIITRDAPAPHFNESGVLIMSICDFLLNADSLQW